VNLISYVNNKCTPMQNDSEGWGRWMLFRKLSKAPTGSTEGKNGYNGRACDAGGVICRAIRYALNIRQNLLYIR